jgi:hypothetical protein
MYSAAPQQADRSPANRLIVAAMGDLCRLIWCAVVGLFWSRAALQTEILVLRHQLKSGKRIAFSNVDRWVFAGLYQLDPNVLNAPMIERFKVPEPFGHAFQHMKIDVLLGRSGLRLSQAKPFRWHHRQLLLIYRPFNQLKVRECVRMLQRIRAKCCVTQIG